MKPNLSLALMVVATLSLGACFDEPTDNRIAGNGPNNPDPPSANNRAPTISGSPTATVVEGELYEFMPSATDPDGDTLQFSIARKPGWATFDRATGRLSGTPDANDVGNFTNIVITVSDGDAAASLDNFDITVDAIASGSATLSWNPPTENVDGSALTDLTGYRIYYGRSEAQLTRTIVIDNPGLTRYVVENLAPSNWHFAMTSVNADGVESRRSPTVSKTIS
jgi:hypothetical protein